MNNQLTFIKNFFYKNSCDLESRLSTVLIHSINQLLKAAYIRRETMKRLALIVALLGLPQVADAKKDCCAKDKKGMADKKAKPEHKRHGRHHNDDKDAKCKPCKPKADKHHEEKAKPEHTKRSKHHNANKNTPKASCHKMHNHKSKHKKADKNGKMTKKGGAQSRRMDCRAKARTDEVNQK